MRKGILSLVVLFLLLLQSSDKVGEAQNRQAITPRAYLPLVSFNLSPPPPSASFYIKDVSPLAMWNLGCSLAVQMSSSNASSAASILHFGQPWRNTSGIYGVRIFDPAVSFVPRSEIESASRSFAVAYGYCSSIYYNNTHLFLGIGVNNFGPHVTYAHGEIWGNIVDTIDASLIGTAAQYRVFVLGAGDLEPGFNTPAATRNWVLGYFSQPSRFTYNFGTADGCPSEDVPGTFDGQCGTPQYPTWKQSDVWFISSGRAGLRAFPEIYATNGVNAEQWYQIALYGYRTGQIFPFVARGSLTQHRACEQRPNEAGCHPNNPYLKNTPTQGWLQFATAIRKDPRTSQVVSYASDIQWQDE
jgi:hypothetical protein